MPTGVTSALPSNCPFAEPLQFGWLSWSWTFWNLVYNLSSDFSGPYRVPSSPFTQLPKLAHLKHWFPWQNGKTGEFLDAPERHVQRPRRVRNETSPAVRDKDGGLTRVIPMTGGGSQMAVHCAVSWRSRHRHNFLAECSLCTRYSASLDWSIQTQSRVRQL